ncbi:MAG: winged helix-turn-helix transcriptional regulator [Desulfobacteraceae bacterium]|nr:winged helix-turn-helix transcriptional regulator [Desulfobacteraceae bacterium]
MNERTHVDTGEDDLCKTVCVHKDAVDAVKKCMVGDETLRELAELFKVLSDHTRIRILHALLHAELCVCDLVDVLDMNQSAVSHQLRVLRTAKVVKYRKEGRNVFYSLDDDHIFSLLRDGMDHVME